MKSISLSYIKDPSVIKCGIVVLQGMTGRRYWSQALYIPDYGWVPCSRKLKNNFTQDPQKLMLVLCNPSDQDTPVTSSIWVTRSNILRTLSL